MQSPKQNISKHESQNGRPGVKNQRKQNSQSVLNTHPIVYAAAKLQPVFSGCLVFIFVTKTAENDVKTKELNILSKYDLRTISRNKHMRFHGDIHHSLSEHLRHQSPERGSDLFWSLFLSHRVAVIAGLQGPETGKDVWRLSQNSRAEKIRSWQLTFTWCCAGMEVKVQTPLLSEQSALGLSLSQVALRRPVLINLCWQEKSPKSWKDPKNDETYPSAVKSVVIVC